MIKRFSILVAILFSSLFLAGCFETVPTKYEEVIVYKTRIQLSTIPDHLLENCAVPIPPEPTNYIALSFEEKEKTLSIYSTDLLKAITICNNTLDKAKKWNADNRRLFNQQSTSQ